ncbi:MAG: hypothetical protein ABI537_00070 [Casimicrobiaceae bacterium]
MMRIIKRLFTRIHGIQPKQERLPADQYAAGSAVNQATRQIGSVLGVASTVLLLGHAGVHRADFTWHMGCTSPGR